MIQAFKAASQARRADGCRLAAVRRAEGAYWPMTAWRDPEALRAFMLSGDHRAAMPRLAGWCDEASLTRFELPDGARPSWQDAERELAMHGRTSRIDHPSPAHAEGLTLGEAGRGVTTEATAAH